MHASLRRHYPHRYQGCDLTLPLSRKGPLASMNTLRYSAVPGKAVVAVPMIWPLHNIFAASLIDNR